MSPQRLISALRESSLRIVQWSEDISEYDDALDPWVTLEELEQVFKSRSIRPNAGKDASLIVLDGDKVVGGSFSEVTNDEGGITYSFDIAILKEYEFPRAALGLSIIKKEIQIARNNDCDKIYAWVVNPGLVRVLETLGYSTIQAFSDGTATMELIL